MRKPVFIVFGLLFVVLYGITAGEDISGHGIRMQGYEHEPHPSKVQEEYLRLKGRAEKNGTVEPDYYLIFQMQKCLFAQMRKNKQSGEKLSSPQEILDAYRPLLPRLFASVKDELPDFAQINDLLVHSMIHAYLRSIRDGLRRYGDSIRTRISEKRKRELTPHSSLALRLAFAIAEESGGQLRGIDVTTAEAGPGSIFILQDLSAPRTGGVHHHSTK
ncbi:MAG: hypothetical protein U5N86_13475 [Planctomycetota bacterium]|nr:hypothetical protein [Planctomycetota bacterium]